MGFLRDLGKFTGKAAGFVVGGTVNVVGEVTGSKFIKEVGDSVKKASEFAGDALGQVADGAWNTASGIIQKDEKKIDNGLNDIGSSVSRTAKGVYHTAKNTYHNGKDIYEGFKDNDDEKIKSGVTNIAKTVAVGALSIGVVDLIDGVDGVDIGGDIADGGNDATVHHVEPHIADSQIDTDMDASSEDPGTHHVKPHWRHLADGREIYVDGDGDPNTFLTEEEGGGYLRSNPDGTPYNNLKS